MSITSHIEYLLMSHDCVIIPGIGAILAHGMPAYYDKGAEKWYAPTRVTAFNPELSRTDGLLAQSVARRECVSLECAAAIVKEQCDELRNILLSQRRLEIGEVGTLMMDRHGSLSFAPGTTPWLSPKTQWLPVLSLSKAKEEENSFGERIAAEASRRRRWKNVRRAVGSAAAVAVLVALGWIVATNLPFAPTIQTASVTPIEVNGQEAADGVFVGQIPTAPAQVILAAEPASDEPAAANAADEMSHPKYMLVVASLSSEQDALKFIAQYPRMQLGLFDSAGRYRVYAASGATWQEAAAAMYNDEIADCFPQAWVCER